MGKDLVSIIVPVYNVQKYLEKCIQSIRRQTYENLEIILSDDGSTDQSGAICDQYACSDSRIRVIHKENGGLSDARNAGIEIASGRYYMFVDSDDTIAPDTVKILYSAATEYHCGIAVCNMVRIYEDGTTRPFYHPTGRMVVLENQQRFETLNQPSVCNKLFLAELFEGVRFPKGRFYEDTFIYHELAYKTKKIVLTGYDGYFYLSRKESILGEPKYTDRYFDFIEPSKIKEGDWLFYDKHVAFYYHGLEVGLLAVFFFYTGLRKGETLALTFGDIDRERARIRVTKSVYFINNTPKLKKPKTAAGIREVIVPNMLLELLPSGEKDEYVFGESPADLMRQHFFDKAWAHWQKETGLDLTAHQLRHGYATLLHEAGIDVKDAQDLLGHADASTTQNIYTEVSHTRREKTAKILNDYLTH